MTLKLAQFCDDPKKYQQNLHTQNNIHFSEKPKKYWGGGLHAKYLLPCCSICDSL